MQGTRSLTRRLPWAAAFIIGLIGTQALASEAAVFKWTDENGIVHYSDVPLDAQARDTGMRSERTDDRAIREQQLLQWEQSQKTSAEEQEDAQGQRVAAQRQAEDQTVIADRCTNARVRAERYANAHRLYEPQPNGDRRYLTDEQLSAARKAAELEVIQWCQ